MPDERLLRRAVAFARLQLQQPLGIEGDGVLLGGRRRRDGAGDDLALHQQVLYARIDQAGAELRQVENADDEREQAGEVEEDDAPGEARKARADEELPGPDATDRPAGARRAFVLRRADCRQAAQARPRRLQAFRGSVEHGSVCRLRPLWPAPPASSDPARRMAKLRRSLAQPVVRMRKLGRRRASHFLEPVADAVERLDHVEVVVGCLNFLRSRLMWLSMVRSST